MSFSSNVKAELCKDSMGRKSCAVAESYGVLLYCNTFTSAEIRIITESRDFAGGPREASVCDHGGGQNCENF